MRTPKLRQRPPVTLYRFFDAADRLLYVGISLSAVSRLAEHSAKPWFREIAIVKLTHHASLKEALAAEMKAIKTEWPLHNVAHNRRSAPLPKTNIQGRLDRAVLGNDELWDQIAEELGWDKP